MGNDLLRMAQLSKIDFSATELQRMEKDMASIIELMDSLRDVELPSEEVNRIEGGNLSMLRDDDDRPGMPPGLLTSQSPGGDDFTIPRIID